MNMHTNPAQSVTPAAAEAGGFLPFTAGHLPPDDLAPNRGAHALMHWLCAATREGIAHKRLTLLNRYGVSDEQIDRLIDGALEPGDELARDIARATDGDVVPADWTESPGPSWISTPVARRDAA